MPTTQKTVLFLMLIASFSFGCKLNQKITGTYTHSLNKTGPGSSTLNINPDGKFTVTGYSDILGKNKISGSWHVQEGLLYLDKRQMKNDDFIKVVTEFGRPSDTTTIKVIDADHMQSIVAASVRINDDSTTYVTDLKGSVTCVKQRIEKICLAYLSVRDTIKVPPGAINTISILISFKNRDILNDGEIPVAWKIKGHRLLPIINGRVGTLAEAYLKTGTKQ